MLTKINKYLLNTTKLEIRYIFPEGSFSVIWLVWLIENKTKELNIEII